jgi:hypothetical protein
MNWYLNFVRGYPFVSAMIQFAVLGTLGDLVSRRLSGSKESASVSLILTKAEGPSLDLNKGLSSFEGS